MWPPKAQSFHVLSVASFCLSHIQSQPMPRSITCLQKENVCSSSDRLFPLWNSIYITFVASTALQYLYKCDFAIDFFQFCSENTGLMKDIIHPTQKWKPDLWELKICFSPGVGCCTFAQCDFSFWVLAATWFLVWLRKLRWKWCESLALFPGVLPTWDWLQAWLTYSSLLCSSLQDQE